MQVLQLMQVIINKMTFTIFKGKKKLGTIQAKNLNDAEKVCNKKYKEWSEIYIGNKKDWENKGKGY